MNAYRLMASRKLYGLPRDRRTGIMATGYPPGRDKSLKEDYKMRLYEFTNSKYYIMPTLKCQTLQNRSRQSNPNLQLMVPTVI
jgi:hypothetical protein